MLNTTTTSSSLIIHISRPVKAIIKKSSLILLFLLAVFGVFISNNDSAFSRSARTYITDTASPVIYLISAPVRWINNIGEASKTYLFVHSKNKKLIEENQTLKKQLVSLSGISYENRQLRALLNYIQTTDYKFISTTVVGNTSSPFLQSVLVNVGEKDGIKKGQAVVNEKGLVGRIIEVGKRSSRVLLLTDINSNIPVLSSISRTHSIMSGNSDQRPRLLYLQKDNKVKEGETALTSGDGDMFPAGIQVGTVSIGSNGSYKINPFVKLHELEHLSVIDYSG